MSTTPAERAPVSKTQFVYEWLQQEILNGSLSPGSRIRQHEVATLLGVSYTPVREAIRQLQATGLITYEPNRGNAVGTLDADAVRELYLLRGAVEGLGARLAAERIDEDRLAELEWLHEAATAELNDSADPGELAEFSRRFHEAILECGGPAVIHAKVREIWTHYPVPRRDSLWGSREDATRALDAHRALIDALRDHDGARAGRLMDEHIIHASEHRLRAQRNDGGG